MIHRLMGQLTVQRNAQALPPSGARSQAGRGRSSSLPTATAVTGLFLGRRCRDPGDSQRLLAEPLQRRPLRRRAVHAPLPGHLVHEILRQVVRRLALAIQDRVCHEVDELSSRERQPLERNL